MMTNMAPAAATMLPRTSMPRSTVPYSAVPARTNQIVRRTPQLGRAGDAASLGLPATWVWGLDASNNPVPTDATGNTVPLPPGATQWGRARPASDQTGAGPSTPVPLDANGYAVAGGGMPSTGIMIGLTVLGLVVGYAFGSGGTRMNPVRHLRRYARRFRHHLRHAHRF